MIRASFAPRGPKIGRPRRTASAIRSLETSGKKDVSTSPRPVHLALLAIGLLFIEVACNLSGSVSAPPPTADPELVSFLTAFDSAPGREPESFRALFEAAARAPEGLAWAAVAALDSPNPDVRFAAIYALTLAASEGQPRQALIDLLSSEEVHERLLAADRLLALGEVQAVPIVIAALSSVDDLPHAEPPQQAWEYARRLLLQYTDEDLGLLTAAGSDDARLAQSGWQSWWYAVGSDLRWNAAERVYQVGGP